MPKFPAVSVIIPTYNRAHLVGRAVRSVLVQSFQDYELLVVDDGSTDNTEEVVRSFGDPCICYITHENNQGPSAARNTGIRASRGQYIAFLDSDDEWLPETLEKQLDVFRTTELPNLGGVICDSLVVDLRGERPGFTSELRDVVYEQLLAFGVEGLGGGKLLISRCVVDGGIRFDESFPAFEDWDFIVQIATRHSLALVSEPLLRQYRDHGGPHVWSEENVLQGRLLILQKYANELKRRPLTLARHHKLLAGEYYKKGDMEGVRRHLGYAWKARPFDPWGSLWFSASSMGDLTFRVVARLFKQLSRPLNKTGVLRAPLTPFK